MNLDDLIGHGPVLGLLAEEANHPAQAYLFVGPANVGKATVARRFAAALLCEGDGDCQRRVIQGIHPDLAIVEPDGRTALTVDQARATVAMASLAPVEGGRKVFLFEEAGLMNDEAANALLKTLEEPTRSTVFLLVTDSEDDLPATVASRARIVHFGRVAEGEVIEALLGFNIDPDQAANAARISGGRPGLALALATRPEVAEFRHAWLSVPLRVSARPGEAYRLAEEVMAASEPLLAAIKARQEAEDGSARSTDRYEREIKRASSALHVTGLEILASWYRDAAAAQLGAGVRNHDIAATALTAVPPATAVHCAERVLNTIDALGANQRPQLAFASLFADLGVE